MTRRIAAVAITACFAVVAAPALARHHQKKNTTEPSIDQHAVAPSSGAPHYNPVPSVRRSHTASPQRSRGSFVNRDCLDGPTRALLNNLEVRFGKVVLVKVCVPGARMPSGHVSWHARHKAFDFRVPRNIDQRDVMVWLTKNSPGVTISYRGALAGIIHTDTGSFRKVIYAAADHEAGERAVAIWQERDRLGLMITLPKPRPEIRSTPIVVASLGDDPMLDDSVSPALPLKPAPIGPEDRRGIFQRYFESKEVVVAKHTSLSCSDGKPFPNGLVRLLNDAASNFGRTAYVNSGYRTPERNRRVGGARNSQHMKCRAVDFRVAGVGIADLRRWVMANLSRYGVGGLGTYHSHIHVDARPLTKATRLVTWTGGHKKRVRYAKHRKPGRYASAG